MDKLFQVLMKNPIILFLIGAWLVGMIGNTIKARKKAAERRRAEEARRPKVDTSVQQPLPEQRQAPVVARREAPQSRTTTQPGGAQPTSAQAGRGSGGRLAGTGAQSPDEIAREMRRILGLDPEPAPPAPRPAPTPPPIEKPPEPVRTSTGSRRLDIHVDPHVGESIRDRHMQETRVGKPSAGRGAIGNLGGRVQQRRKAVGLGSRYSLEDLRQAIVINEILSPPVSVRPHDDRRPG
ncbi:MAG: hypothetical protein ACE37K_03595 [Planctomycetota bacterium]